MVNIAIIGGGISGLTVANILRDDANVTVFEKARGVGGRMSTRRAEHFNFDHGTQFFTAKTKEFQSFLDPLIKQDIVQIWNARFVEFEQRKIVHESIWNESYPHYVGVPSMNAIAKFMAQDLDISLNTKITTIKQKSAWHLIDDQGNSVGDFDWVISTAPAAQAADLMPKSFLHYGVITSTKMFGCFSLMFGFNQPLKLHFDAALVREANISWMSVNSSKPQRPQSYCLLIHSTNKWAEEHLDDDRKIVMAYMCGETSRIIDQYVAFAEYKAIHGWRYANIKKQHNREPLIDFSRRLAACGDWCIQGNVEAAFTSGFNTARAIREVIKK